MSDFSEKIARLSPKRLALLALELQEKLDAVEGERREPIAVVGIGCRFPGGAADPDAFWRLLRDGVDAVTEVPPERWDVEAYYDPDPEMPARTYSRHGAFISDVDRFDPQFFGIAPREALRMDPQQRLVLEVSWEALEHAGIAPAGLAESQTGVFVGISGHEYGDLLGRGGPKYLDAHFLTGNPLNFAAGRLSYILGLQGPSMAIDTACSSSLVAVHLACQSLRAKECHLALAAGVNLVLVPEANVVLAKARMLAVDGRCKTFDAAADGYVRGEGCGVLVLKRLSDAVSSGDRILAVIRGSAINQDGPSSGLTVPNGRAQRALIREALSMAGLKPADVSYVEAHGTGTSLGDPIEVQALGAALGEGRSPANPLLIGSVKTNVGHLEAAAGVAGLIKVILALKHRTIPPHLHLKTLNPNISLEAIPAAIPVEPTAWAPLSGRRIAGVSSFGASGTNAHVVLEEAPDAKAAASGVERPVHLLALSARTADALDELAGRFAARLREDSTLSLADVCFTANAGRSHFAQRLAAIGADAQSMSLALERAAKGEIVDGLMRGQTTGPDRPKVAFVFPAAREARPVRPSELHETQPGFRRAFDRCAEVLQTELGSASLFDTPAMAEPAVFASQYALAELWRAWGVEPAALVGFGVGEYVAACVAGVLTLEHALKLVVARSRSQGELDAAVAAISYRRPAIAMVPSLAGSDVSAAPFEATYWQRQARSAPAVSGAVEKLRGLGLARFLEIGSGEVADEARSAAGEDVLWLSSLGPGGGDWRELLRSAARLYTCGFAIDWPAFDREYRRRKVALPTYPFRRQRFWPDVTPSTASASAADIGDPLLGSHLRTALSERLYECRLTPESPPFLADHRLRDTIVFPATGYVGMALAAARDLWPGAQSAVEDLVIQQPLIVTARGRTVQTVLTPLDAASLTIKVLSREPDSGEDDEWQLNASGVIRRADRAALAPKVEDFDAVRSRCNSIVAADAYYDALAAGGLNFGPAFRGIVQLRSGVREALGEIALPESAAVEAGRYPIHPAALDACFQALGAARGERGSSDTYLPLGIARVRLFGVPGSRMWSHVRLVSDADGSPETLTADVTLYDAERRPLGVVEGLQLKRAGDAAAASSGDAQAADSLYEIAWQQANAVSATGFAEGTWLVLEEDGGIGSVLASRLEESGRRVVRARPGGEYRSEAAGIVHLDPASPEHFDRLLREIATAGPALGGVVQLWGLDSPNGDAAAGSLEQQRAGCASTLHVAQTLIRRQIADGRLYVITRGAQAIGGEQRPASVGQAPLWGLCRTLAAEHPELQCVRIDLDPVPQPGEIDAVVEELGSDAAEDQVALRGSQRYVPRLARHSNAAHDDRPVRLGIDERGVLTNLRLQPVTRQAPGPGEIEIRVLASGLNFRDVLNALGMYPGDPGPIGNECVGTVVAVGRGVHTLEAGQTVLALGGGTFATYVTTPADLAAPVPHNLTVEQAATIPITFLTAEYALNRLARMKAGDRVLVHAAAGGVGLAAVQLARRAGAEIFATAGSPEKRELLKSLGVPHVMDSRSLAFADEIMTITNGEGIDIVLNSLAGEFIPRSLGTLRTGGRFLEIGKTGIWDADAVRTARPEVAYHAIYLGEVPPPEIQAMLRHLVAELESGRLTPLPLRVFPIEQAVDAFRFMAQARHVGKLVISQPQSSSSRTPSIRNDRSYLITGGYGGLGLIVARWMIDRGARHVVLAGRRGPSPRALETIAALSGGDAQVRIVQADVGAAADVADMLRDIAATMPPLGGIVHAAGVLDDGALLQQTWPRFGAVMLPKMAGAWNLHEQTRDLALDFFVLFSSAAAILGNPGQANYAAANAFLDALAHHRRAQGLPAVSINWGPWADAGMAADLERSRRRWEESGVSPITAELGLAALERAIGGRAPQLAVLPVRWRTFMQRFAPGAEPRLLADFGGARRPAASRAVESRPTVRAELVERVQDIHPSDRPKVVSGYVREQTLNVLGLEPDFDLAPHQGLRDLGLDSLLAVELRNRLQRGIGRSLPATLAFDCPTVEALTDYLVNKALPEAKRPVRVATNGIADPAAKTRAVQPLTPLADDGIAVIGLGCRLPGGANDPEAFWQRLQAGYDATSEVPADRWELERYYDADPDAVGKMYTRRGAFLDRVDLFDPQFFGMAPREAISLDPQQRLLLEVSWEALEHAGQAPDKLLGSKTGVFVGINGSDYGFLQMAATASTPDLYFGTGNASSAAAGRLSYVYGLQGPSISIDTACSSSLVAVHLAAQSLRSGECRLAIAGGVNVMLNPDVTVNFCRARMLSPEGRCKTFDAAADGYVRGEGCGIVVLKRLSDAATDGDRILAVIRGTAVNQDGRSSGLTVPNGPAQEAVVRDALRMAGIEPAEVDYVEAHGTGTSLGDPIEVQALGAVLGTDRPADRPLLVGSVKTNIGHLEAAAGISSLIKVVLALQHGEIPRHLHFSTPNPHIAWDELPVKVAAEGASWPAGAARRIAGVSSFGFTGTNAHLVIEGPPAPERNPIASDRPAHVLALSAKSEEALQTLAAQCADRLAQQPLLNLADACYTANAGRSHFNNRVAVIASSTAEIRERLRAFNARTACPGVVRGALDRTRSSGAAFLFTGQGSQYAGMGRELYESQPAFRAALDRCAEILSGKLKRPLLEVMFSASEPSPLDETAYTQPALFSIEYALSELWRSWGVVPTAVLGHSVGEYVAACVAGVFSLEDALTLIAARGRLMQALPGGGGMVAVAAPEAIVREAIRDQADRVSIAGVNGPAQVVISGEVAALDAVVDRLRRQSVRATPLAVSHAFHSSLLEPMLDAFEAVASTIRYERPRMPVISNVTGAVAAGDDLITPAYWRRHAREAVQFARGAATLASLGERVVVEVGPQPTLIGLARQIADAPEITWAASLRPGRGDWATLLEAVAALYARGVAIDWEGFDRGFERRKVALPTYPFQRQRYWVESSRATERAIAASPVAAEPAARDHLYDVGWQPKPLPESPGSEPGSWLVVGERADLTDAVVRLLEAAGSVVVAVDRNEDLSRAADAFLASMPPPRGVVSLLSLDGGGGGDAAERGYQHCQEVLDLVKAFVRPESERAVRLWLVTRGAQAVPSGAGPVAPDQSAIWGLGRSIAAEHAAMWGGLIDLDPGADSASAAAAVVAAMTAGDEEDQTAFRGGQRFAARLRPLTLAAGSAPRWQPDGAYVITGGFGGLGFEVARWLARTGARRLILLGRHGVPPRVEWDQVDPASPPGARVAAIVELESFGATVDAEAIDVGNRELVAGWLDRYRRERRPRIRGVFHAAGVTQYRAVAEHTSDDLRQIWSGKASGAWTLHELLGDDLDCFVMFSSAAAILSSPMLGSYAAANAFLDGLAEARRAAGRPVLSVNWGSWSRVGMAAAADERRPSGKSEFISPEDGVRTLAALLAAKAPRAAVLPMDWDEWRRRYPVFASAPLLSEIIARTPAESASAGGQRTSIRAALAEADSAARVALVEDMLMDAVTRVLRIPRAGVGPDIPLRHLGLDSLMALELRNHVQDRAGVTVPLVTFVEGPSIGELTGTIVGAFEESLDMAGAAPEARPSAPQDAQKLLERVDELSDESVDALLRRMLAERGT